MLPVDPDLGSSDSGRLLRPESASSAFPAERRERWPRIHWGSVAAVVAGAIPGGIARYLIELAWPAGPGKLPWALVGTNTTGVFILALVLILILEVLPPTVYLRVAVGTGFCGALTTFSSVATGVDQLIARGHPGLAGDLLLVSLGTSLGAGSLGIIVGRSVAASRGRGR